MLKYLVNRYLTLSVAIIRFKGNWKPFATILNFQIQTGSIQNQFRFFFGSLQIHII